MDVSLKKLVHTIQSLLKNQVTVNKELAMKWLQNGAKPSDTVRSILSKEGIMKEFHETKMVKK